MCIIKLYIDNYVLINLTNKEEKMLKFLKKHEIEIYCVLFVSPFIYMIAYLTIRIFQTNY